MCDVCEYQFNVMSAQFTDAFTEYLEAHNTGVILRDTPATRTHDLAFAHQQLCDTERGRIAVSWFLAIAMERLVALESAGVPT